MNDGELQSERGKPIQTNLGDGTREPDGPSTNQLTGPKRRNDLGERLEALLKLQFAQGTIRGNFWGGIYKKWYAEYFGCTKSALTYHGAIFKNYESRLSGKAGEFDIPHVHLSQVDRWALDIKIEIARQWEARTLQVIGYNIVRSAILSTLGIPVNSRNLRRAPIAKVFDEWDNFAREQQYISLETEQKLARLKELLLEEEYINQKTGKLNKLAVLRALGYKDGVFVEPFASVVEEYDRELTQANEADPLAICGRGAPLTIRPLLDKGYKLEALTRISEGFRDEFLEIERSELRAKHRILVSILSHWSSPQFSASREVFEWLNRFRIMQTPDRAFQLSILEFQNEIGKQITPTSLDNAMVRLNSIMRMLQRIEVVPALHLHVRKTARRSQQPRPSFAEIRASTASLSSEDRISEFDVEQILSFARQIFDEDDADLSGQIDSNDTRHFMEVLRAEIESLPRTSGLNPATAILMVTNKRLKILQDHFWSVFQIARRHYEEGQRLQRRGVDPATYWERYRERVADGRLFDELRTLFPLNDRDVATANVLALAARRYHGVFPNNRKTDPGASGFFRRRALELGGRENLQDYLRPSNDLVGAVIALYLLESGANSAVGRTLSASCIEDCDEPGFKRVTGSKAKAKGKPIVAYLEQNGCALPAMEWLLANSKSARRRASKRDAKRLFLVEIGSKLQAVNAEWFLNWFKRQVAQIERLGGANIMPSSIRPSILLKAVLENDGSLARALAIAQHTEKVAPSYYFRFPIRFLHDVEIREFQRIMEAIAIHKLANGRVYLGLSEEQYQDRLAQFDTGLGTLCNDPYGCPGKEGSRCTELTCWKCPQARLLAVPEQIAPLILWQKSLVEAEPLWVRDHPEKWEKKYLPWLCFVEVVEEKMQKAALADIWDDAQVLAAQIMAQPDFRPYRPF